MSELASFVAKMPPNALGETLRGLTFVGEDGEVGCYETFDVRQDATRWPTEERQSFLRENPAILEPNETNKKLILVLVDEQEVCETGATGLGYTFTEDGLTIDVFWDCDDMLAFRVRNGDEVVRLVVNDDRKKDYRWQNILAA